MKKRYIKILGILMVAVFSLALYGCGGGDKKSKDGKITLKLWIMPNSMEPLIDIETVLKEFERQNPDIKIKITSVDWGAAWTKLTSITVVALLD